jgi:tripartite-type tricarboxylate transporter receptor subunit TctC
MSFLRAFVLAAAALFACAAPAQDYPKSVVKLVVPFPPGGPTDVVGRLMAQKLAEAWGGAGVIVENRPGAGTSIGTDAVAKSAPDGHTIGMVITAYMINPSLQAKLPFDTLKDLTNVTQLVTQHVVLVANPKLPFNTVAELVAYAKKNPGKLTYASPGSGTSAHLAGELVKAEAGIDMVHAPYKGSGPAQADLIAGRVDLMVDVYHSAKPQVDAGKLKIIALASPRRPAGLSQYPVIAETLPNVSVTSLFGLIVPAGTPRPIVQKIQADSAKVLALPDVRERLAALGLEPVGSSPEQFDAFVRSEIAKWAKLIKDNNIKAD